MRKNRWEGKNPNSAQDVAEVDRDFKLRPEVDDYLSFFEVSNEEEGRQLAAVFKVVQPGRPDLVDFLLFPREFLGPSAPPERRPSESLRNQGDSNTRFVPLVRLLFLEPFLSDFPFGR